MWYNQTEVATKMELEKVKGLIDVSARLIKTKIAWGKTDTISISEPFDYCKVISIPGIDLESLSIVATCKLTKDCQCVIPVMVGNRDGVRVERTIFTMDVSGVIRHNLISGTDFKGVTFEFYKYQ